LKELKALEKEGKSPSKGALSQASSPMKSAILKKTMKPVKKLDLGGQSTGRQNGTNQAGGNPQNNQE